MDKFKDTQGERLGKGIKILRQRSGLSRQQLAARVNRSEEYLKLMEEGHNPNIDYEALENIAEAIGVRKRGGKLTKEQLINIFLCATKCDPPKLFL